MRFLQLLNIGFVLYLKFIILVATVVARNVIEYLEYWPNLCNDIHLDLDQRIHLAANTLELVNDKALIF